MELGCFLAGALISSQGHMITEEITSCIEPIRDFLAIIFFATIGNLFTETYTAVPCFTNALVYEKFAGQRLIAGKPSLVL